MVTAFITFAEVTLLRVEATAEFWRLREPGPGWFGRTTIRRVELRVATSFPNSRLRKRNLSRPVNLVWR